MAYSWMPVVAGHNDSNAMYGVTDVFHFAGNTEQWAYIWYDDPVPATPSEPAQPSQYSYQVQVPYEYYEEVNETVNYNGVIVAQTFISPRAGWITNIGLYITQIAAEGEIKVLVTKTIGGKPDLSKVVTTGTILRNDLKKYPEESRVSVKPMLAESGARYAVVLITQGAHYVAMADAGFTEGTFFTGTDGEFMQGDLKKDMKLRVYMARFLAPRYEITLQNVSLANGITDIEMSTERLVPDGCSLTIEMQIAGKWEPIREGNLGKLSGKPDIVPLRAVFLGSADVHAGIQLGTERIVASRPTEACPVESKVITCPSRRYFQVDLLVNRWDAAQNSVNCQLKTGAGYTTLTSPTSTVILDDESRIGWKRLRMTFDVGAPVTSYKVRAAFSRVPNGIPSRLMERTSIGTS